MKHTDAPCTALIGPNVVTHAHTYNYKPVTNTVLIVPCNLLWCTHTLIGVVYVFSDLH
jgi:hypothetical protein